MDRRTETGMLLEFYGALLTQKQRTMLLLHYDEDLSLGEIAQQENISRQAVHDALVRGEEQLREYESRLGLMARDTALAKELRALMEKETDAGARETLARLIERIEGTDGV